MTSDSDRTSIRNPQSAIRNRRGWLWFFVVLAVLGVAAMGINWAYNARQQLKPEQLTAAMEQWNRNGPVDYDLTIEKQISSAASEGEPIRETIEAKVRRGKVLSATLDGRPIPSRVWPEYDMPGWFSFIEEYLRQDSKPGAPRVFCAAEFDAETGALVRFRRRVSGTRERQELNLHVGAPKKLEPPTNPDKPK